MGNTHFSIEEGHFFFKEDHQAAFENSNQGSLAVQL